MRILERLDIIARLIEAEKREDAEEHLIALFVWLQEEDNKLTPLEFNAVDKLYRALSESICKIIPVAQARRRRKRIRGAVRPPGPSFCES